MKNGICVKCGSAAVCTSEMGFQQDAYRMPLGGIFDGVISVTRLDYVCTQCGYYEEYIVEREALDKIAEMAKAGKRDWRRVPVS